MYMHVHVAYTCTCTVHVYVILYYYKYNYNCIPHVNMYIIIMQVQVHQIEGIVWLWAVVYNREATGHGTGVFSKHL